MGCAVDRSIENGPPGNGTPILLIKIQFYYFNTK